MKLSRTFKEVEDARNEKLKYLANKQKRCFAFLPKQMNTGEWVFFEYYYKWWNIYQWPRDCYSLSGVYYESTPKEDKEII